jgi:ATP-dependent phosphofructokinase / diphosphate-dependent phosphofructokinase
MAIKRIGILTGGGDVPGLNAVIKSATYRSSENDIEIFGLRRGWEALTHLNIEDASSRSRFRNASMSAKVSSKLSLGMPVI